MVTVRLNASNKEHTISSFEKKMMKICEKHKSQKRALAFAFLIYDFDNENVSKVLNDYDYWMALNELSGEYLTVFSFNYKPKQKENLRKEKKSKRFKYLSSFGIKRNLKTATDKISDTYFNGATLTYPSILFFQVDSNEVIDSLQIKLKEETVEQTYLEVKKYISAAVESIGKVTNENRANSREIFTLIASGVEARKAKIQFERVSKKFGNVIGLISSIKGLFSN